MSALRKAVRDCLLAWPPAWRLSRRIRRLMHGFPEPDSATDRILGTLAREARNVRFVQVGSCDAAFGDPIILYVLGYGWRGVMIEPAPVAFAMLRERHGSNARLRLENVAIGEIEGPRPFYYLEPVAELPHRWYHQLGSFSRAHIEKHDTEQANLSGHIRETSVTCVRLATLLERHGISELDLLQVDAEGADFEVLRSLDFDRVSPRMILFEMAHLPPGDASACRDFLAQRGYDLLDEGRDCLALLREARGRWPATARRFDELRSRA